MSRMLGAVPSVADAIVDQLSQPADKATNSGGCANVCSWGGEARHPRRHMGRNLSGGAEAAAMAAALWRITSNTARHLTHIKNAQAVPDSHCTSWSHVPPAAAARRPQSESEAEAMAAAVWRATWPVERIRQRAFNNFGMDMLLSLNLAQIRDFFAAFFSLSDYHW